MHILLVEDEIFLANLTVKQFKQENVKITSEYDGSVALEKILNEYYDVILLDIMLPGMNGLEILEEVRKKRIETPVIITSAKSSVADKVKALELGADDYMTKPFDFIELYARIKTLLRRSGGSVQVATNSFGDLMYERSTLVISNDSGEVNLTMTEFNLVEYLITSSPMPVSKEQIIDRLWGHDAEVSTNQVEVYISYLRKKLKLLDSNVVITTKRQVGYLIEVSNV